MPTKEITGAYQAGFSICGRKDIMEYKQCGLFGKDEKELVDVEEEARIHASDL